MAENPKISERIKVLKETLGLTSNRALEKGYHKDEKTVVSNGLIAQWELKDLDWTSKDLERFLNYYKVNREWWKTGTGQVLLTSVPKASDNKEMIKHEEVYRTLIEGHTEYLLVPRSVLNETQLVSTEQIKRTWDELAQKNVELAEKNKELENKNKQIDFYQGQFAKLLENLELSTKFTDPKVVKNKG